MRLISHIRLALSILSSHPMGFVESLAYIFGNIQPDLCVITYFRGTSPGDERRGHNYRTAIKRIGKLEECLVPDGIAAAYTLGKITHYAADCFTYPHNPDIFHGLLSDHMKYERKLDRKLVSVLESGAMYADGVLYSPSSFLSALHTEYMGKEMCEENDISYILLSSIMLRTAFSYESGRFARRAFAGRVR